MAWGMVVGGSMYLSQMLLPWVRMARSKALPALGDLVGGAVLVGVLEALPVFAGELGVDGQQDEVAGSPLGNLRAKSTTSLVEGLMLTCWRNCSGENICSSCWPTRNSPTPPRDLTLEKIFLRSPTPVASSFISPRPFWTSPRWVGDLAEGLGEAGLEGGVELLVDGVAHLLELGGVVGVELFEAVFDGGAELVLVRGVGAHEVDELGVEGLAEGGVLLCGLGGKGCEALGEGVHLVEDCRAEEVV